MQLFLISQDLYSDKRKESDKNSCNTTQYRSIKNALLVGAYSLRGSGAKKSVWIELTEKVVGNLIIYPNQHWEVAPEFEESSASR